MNCQTLAIVVLAAYLVKPATAQEAPQTSKPPKIHTWKVAISAASPRPPILRYSLLPEPEVQSPGNAAPLYYRAAVMSQQTLSELDDGGHTMQQIKQWLDLAPGELPLERVQEKLALFENALAEISMASHRASCDWELPNRELGRNVLDLEFRELAQFRDLTLVLALRIRQKIAQQRFEDALADIQAGYYLARNLGRGETTLIHTIVGYAITSIIDEQLLSLISMPECPNLYWPLTNVPQPRVPIEGALKSEHQSVSAMYPEVWEARQKEHNIKEYWQQRLQAVVDRQQASYAADHDGKEIPLFETLIASQAPRIKMELADKFGYDPLRLSKLTWNKAVLLYSGLEYERIWDQTAAPLNLPYYQARTFYDDNPLDDRDGMLQGDPFLIAELYMPSFRQLHVTKATAQLRIELLRTLEAIRDYAAHEKKLPEKLKQIVELPIPQHPLSGAPLSYTLREKGKAMLEGASVDGSPGYQIEIELR